MPCLVDIHERPAITDQKQTEGTGVITEEVGGGQGGEEGGETAFWIENQQKKK